MRRGELQGLIVLCLTVLVLLLGAFAVATSYEDNATKQIASIEYRAENHGDAQAEKEKPFLHALFHDPTAFFTMVLAVFTICLAAFTWRLFRVTKDGIADQSALTREALGHARVSAEAAKESADAVTAAERCYIRVMDLGCNPSNAFSVDTHSRYGVAISANFFLRNYGKSPADIVAVSGHINIGNILYPNSEDQEASTPFDVLQNHVIAANADSDRVSIADRVYISRQESNELVRESLYIWLELFVMYYDVFGKRQISHDWWCYKRDRRGTRRFTRRIEDD